MNNRTDYYCSWLPYGGGQTVRDTEIGINALVAETIGNVAKYKFSFYVCVCVCMYETRANL